ncbi:MAG: Grx4 family monothiol glutaredoxin [Gammaproteobacteria bacterium]|nr:Grx4 family monothiol glutaredoxin [Gammaproteobacteria bacterium]
MTNTNTNTNTLNMIKEQISSNPIILYMKGTPQFPQCGFSGQVVQILKLSGVENYAHVNILENPDIRAELPKYADWPTFPQLYVNGELIGGCDIVTELYQSGELSKVLETKKSN